MDCTTTTEDLMPENKLSEENLLFDIVKEVLAEPNLISGNLSTKIKRIISNTELGQHSSLHKLSSADDSSAYVLGFINLTSSDLSYDEQSELNQAVIEKIEEKMPKLIYELEQLSKNQTNKKTKQQILNELHLSLEEKLKILEQQENEKVELMMDWLNHRLQDAATHTENSTELVTLKTKILDLKSKILHMQILQNIFTETNQSIRAYKDVHEDLKDTIRESRKKIREYNELIGECDD